VFRLPKSRVGSDPSDGTSPARPRWPNSRDCTKEKKARFDEARQILWMYTSRDVYRMLVLESGWTPDRYQDWLSDTLVNALASQVEGDRPIRGRIRRRFPARRSHG
jgi:hypothetical protein